MNMSQNEMAVIAPIPAPNSGASESLADIREVSVDKTLPKAQRVAEFIRQIGNPHHFRCGDFIVQARYADDGATLEDCLQGILL